MALYTYLDYLKRNLRCRIGRGQKVIDIGAGHAPLIRADVLCDMFPLDAAGRSISAIFMPAGRFVIGDITDLPFRDKCFDFAYSRATLEHVPDPVRACREISRISRAGLLSLPSSLWEVMGGSAQHLWLISKKDGGLVFRRKTPEDAALSARIPESIRNSREYEKLFAHFHSDFFIEHRWEGSLRATVEGPVGGAQESFKKTVSGSTSLTAEHLREAIKRGDGVMRRIRHGIFSLLRTIQGGTAVDLLSVIACPACKGPLEKTALTALTCRDCRLDYPFLHGVPVLLRDQATSSH